MIKIDFASLSTVSCPMCGKDEFQFEAVRLDSGRITKCSHCGHLYLNPPVPERVLDAVYEESYSHSDQQFRGEIEDWFLSPQGPYQSALRYLRGAHYSFVGKRLFEVGAGAGRFLVECRKEGALVEGLDFFPKAVSIAKKYFDLNLICCSIEKADVVPDGTYDFVFAFEVIEHLYKPKELLRFAHRILKKGGVFVLSTPNFEIFKKSHNNCYASAPAQEHLHYFTLKTIRQCLQDDFEVDYLTTVSPILFGDRQKSILIHNKLVWKIWMAVRGIPFLYWLKEKLPPVLNKVKNKIDSESLNGADLLCCARKR